MGGRDRRWVLRRRLRTQRLSSPPLPAAADVVRLLACVQSQERDHALFSLGLRSAADTYAGVLAELDAGRFVRTHILRPTWHFVAPEDLRWILALTSPRVLAASVGRHRELGLEDPAVRHPALDAVVSLLAQTPLTRAEIGTALALRGVPITAGPQLGHLLMIGELEALWCSGPSRGAQHAYALVDSVVPPAAGPSGREDGVRELVRRYVLGHGPTTERDFSRWSSLTLTEVRPAVASLADAGDIGAAEVEGLTVWFDPADPPRARPRAPAGYLFPTYDEAVLSYPQLGFRLLDGHPASDNPDPFWAMAVVDERAVGLWKRVVNRDRVEVRVLLATGATADDRAGVTTAAERLADFHQRPVQVIFEAG